MNNVEHISKEVYEQVKWERDIALYQLKQVHKELGEKMDDIQLLIERQVPKKYDINEFGDYVCPGCGMSIPKRLSDMTRMYTTDLIKGCPFCLQAIDWGNNK